MQRVEGTLSREVLLYLMTRWLVKYMTVQMMVVSCSMLNTTEHIQRGKVAGLKLSTTDLSLLSLLSLN